MSELKSFSSTIETHFMFGKETDWNIIPLYRNVQVCPWMVSAKGLPETRVSDPWRSSQCGYWCGDPGHPLHQRQGVFHHHEHVLQCPVAGEQVDNNTEQISYQTMTHIHRIWTNNTIEPEFWYPVSLEFLNDLWIPNVFIYNLKSFQNIAVLKRLAGESWTAPNITSRVWHFCFIRGSGFRNWSWKKSHRESRLKLGK